MVVAWYDGFIEAWKVVTIGAVMSVCIKRWGNHSS